MANIKPFRGYKYNREKIGNISDVVCPSHYRMSDEERAEYYKKSEYNAVRIFSGEERLTDSEISNKFIRSAKTIEEWINKGILAKEEKEAIYLYEQTLTVFGTTYSNKNFITLVELEDLETGNVKPCEEFHETSLRDYYESICLTGANTSMISCLYVEREKVLLNLMNSVSENKPDFEFDTSDIEKVHEKVWVITDKEIIAKVQNELKDMTLYITDGQTRYEACLRYQSFMKENNPEHTGKEAYNYTLVSLMNANSDGLVIMPYHREVKCPRGFKEDYFISAVQDHFKIEKIIVDRDEGEFVNTIKQQIATTRKETKLAAYCGGNYFYRILLKDTDYIKKNMLEQMSDDYCNLDVVVLNKLILEDILNIKEETYEERVKEVSSRTQVYTDFENGECEVVFFLNPVKADQIKNVTAVGEKLPHMSVSVFPKPPVGIVINVMREDNKNCCCCQNH